MAAILPAQPIHIPNIPRGRSRSSSGSYSSSSSGSLFGSFLSTLGSALPLPSRCGGGSPASAPRSPALTLLEPLSLTDIDDSDLPEISSASGSLGSRSSNGGRTGRAYLEGGGGLYSCCSCRAHLAAQDDMVSKCFQGRGGRAFLLERCVNVRVGPSEERLLMTGLHAVADIFCACCDTLLGWKYEEAFESSQKYKEGKYILEKAKVMFDREPDANRMFMPEQKRRCNPSYTALGDEISCLAMDDDDDGAGANDSGHGGSVF